jgi:T-complex protein 1 subunit gamma
MEISGQLVERAKKVEGLLQLPYQAVANALEIIPRTLAQNCGSNVIKVITELRKKHSDQNDENRIFYGIDGQTGKVENMKALNIWDPINVKKQTLKTSIEVTLQII